MAAADMALTGLSPVGKPEFGMLVMPGKPPGCCPFIGGCRAACGFVSMPSDWKMALTSLGCCAGCAKGCTPGGGCITTL